MRVAISWTPGNWPLALASCTGFLHWLLALASCTGFLHWLLALASCTGLLDHAEMTATSCGGVPAKKRGVSVNAPALPLFRLNPSQTRPSQRQICSAAGCTQRCHTRHPKKRQPAGSHSYLTTMASKQVIRLLYLVSVLILTSGCGTVSLRPRSVECMLATLVSPGAACQPLARASDDLDEQAKRFTSIAGRTQIYIVRPSIVGGKYLWGIQVDGKFVGAIAEHTYLLLEVDPGAHAIAVVTGENRHSVNVDARDGDNLFLQTVARLGMTSPRAELQRLDRAKGEVEVRGTRRVDTVAPDSRHPDA